MTAHATLGPSSAQRWLTCTASPALIQSVYPNGVDTGGAAAQEGTWAHRAAELAAIEQLGIGPARSTLNRWKRQWRKEVPPELHDEMTGHAAKYAQLLAETRDEMAGNVLCMAEHRVDTGIHGVWGTADFVMSGNDEVVVVDYKYGRGVAVDPTENPQLKLYALGALDELSLLREIPDDLLVTLCVVQPRNGEGGGQWTTTAGELIAWRESVVLPAVRAIEEGEGVFKPSESACRWCPVAGRCVAQMTWATNRDFGDPQVMTPEQMSESLEQLAGLENWIKSVRAKALEMCFDESVEIPGWKAVLASGRRAIKDHASAIEALSQAGFEPAVTSRPNTRTITELAKVTGGADELQEILGDLLVRSPSKQTLVSAKDPRPAVTAESVAASEFGVVGPDDDAA